MNAHDRRCCEPSFSTTVAEPKLRWLLGPGHPMDVITDGEGMKLAVTGTADMPGYGVSFQRETPAGVVTTAVDHVLATSVPAAHG
ncbi:hypothetical protein [Streptomyces sp. NPDC058486]|uniref:hypothetical protein n=1 Tax=unclassified Streptomyces TaxID=2593676 RepID=UPI003666FCFE